jgi:hypothetical protein
MKLSYAFLLLLVACNNNEPNEINNKKDSTTQRPPMPAKDTNYNAADTATQIAAKVYANQRFKEVTAEQVGENKFKVRGKGQIFEASFGWVIEDGHNELAQGFESTNAGAPEWGIFDFTVEAKKVRPNSTLHLILFETSAKDGSRQYELPVLLH